MKPVKLVMSAFGSYAEKVTIDFSSMEQGLFLIAGDTGAGKSTIFEAMLFALYGKFGKKGKEGSMMRSEYAKDSTPTYVEFAFQYRSNGREQTYTVIRFPQQERKSKRKNRQGEYGTVSQMAKVSLILPDQSEYPGKIDEVNAKIQEIIGLTAEQFTRMVMIAQGEFQALIMDSTKNRKAIFQKIFSTEIYEQIEKKMYEKSKKQLGKVLENKNRLETVFQGAKIADESGDWKEVIEFVKTEPDRVYAYLKDYHIKEKEQLKEVRSVCRALETECKKQEEKQRIALEKNKAIEEYERAEAEVERLLAMAEDMEEKKQQCILAKKAQQVQYKKENYEQLITLERTQKKRLEEAIKEKERLQIEAKKAEKEKTDFLQEYESTYHGLLQHYEGILASMECLEEVQKKKEALKEITKKVESLENKIRQQQEQKHKKELRKKELNLWSEEHRDCEADYERLLGEKREIGQQKKLLLQYQKESRQLEILEKKNVQGEECLFAAIQESEKAESQYRQLQFKYLSSQSVYLAQKLKEGMPCPVCGSTKHPNPCGSGTQEVTLEMLTRQEQIQKECRKTVQEKQLEFEKRKNEIAYLQERLKEQKYNFGTYDRFQAVVKESETDKKSHKCTGEKLEGILDEYTTEVEENIAVCEKRIREKKLAYREIEEIEAQLADMEPEMNRQQKELADGEKEKTKLQIEYEQKKQALTIASYEEGKRLLTENEKARKQLQKKKQETEQRDENMRNCLNTLLGNIEEGRENQRKTKKEKEERKKEYEQSMAMQGFASEEQFRDAYAFCEQSEMLETQINTYQMQKVHWETKKSTLQKQTGDGKKADTDALQEILEKKQKELQDRQSVCEELFYAYQTNEEVMKRGNKLIKEWESQRESGKVIAVLNNTLRGNGRISFQTYVQRQYFRQIIEAANKRLAVMVSGQFLLQCKDLSLKSRGEEGLDLEVYNPLSGRVRDVHTLSGGEMFMASLALALGMSDIVRQTVGKTRLDTMFIDEGFGSLSEDVRNTAVTVLLELAKKNRLVGVISHVSELREQIPNRLIVEKNHTGSRVHWEKD